MAGSAAAWGWHDPPKPDGDATFETATAEVVADSWFSDGAGIVMVTYETDKGEKVTLSVEDASGDERTIRRTSFGFEQRSFVYLGLFKGGPYPLEVTASTSEETLTGTIDGPDDVADLIETEQAPFFDVSVAGEDVTAGAVMTVDGTVENTGDESDTQNVTLSVADQSITESITLAPGESETLSLDWQTEAGDAGDYTASLESANDTDSTTVTVEEPPEPAFFDVSIDDTDAPVEHGETLTVDATIENTGDLGDEQPITLSVTDGPNSPVDEQTVSLAGGESTAVSLEWDTGTVEEAGNVTATVSSENDSDSVDATVTEPAEPPFFDVSITDTDSPVEAGEPLTVTASVENTGGQADTQDVTLAIDGTDVISEPLPLNGNQSGTVTLEWTTDEADAGNHTATVSSENDSDSVEVTVTEPPEPPFFDVSIDDTNAPVEEGETLTVEGTITNTGEVSDTQDVTLETDGVVDTETISLAGDDSTSVTLEWATADGDAGNYTATVSSENDSDSAAVTVEDPPEPAFFDVAITDTNSPVVENDTLTVDADVSNTGELSDTQNVELAVDGSTVDSQSVSLAGDNSTSITLEWDTADGDADNYTATISSENDSDSVDVTVQEPADPAFFEVAITDTNSPIQEGDTLTVAADVTNTGELSDTQNVDLVVDGSTVDSQSVSLAAGDGTSVTLEWTTDEADAGNYTAAVSSEDDSDSVDVTVEAPTIPDFESFTAYGTDGVISVGDSLTQELTECAFDEPWPDNESAECISVVGSIDSGNETYATGPSPAVNFPSVVAMDLVPVQINVPEGFTGDFNQQTGAVTVEGPVEVLIGPYGYGGSCGIDIDLQATTGTSGSETGSPLTMTGPTSGVATVVNGTYSVPAIQDGCDGDEGLFNSVLGLPSASGNNNISLTLEFEFSNNETPLVVEELGLENPRQNEDLETVLDAGETTNASAMAFYEHRATHDVTPNATWSTSDSNVVSIDESSEPWSPNRLTAEGPGTAEITATYMGETAAVTVSVNDTAPVLESIDLALDETTLNESESTGATVTATYDNSSTADVTDTASISSSNASVATVTDGTVTAEGAGTATIEASYQGETDTEQVTVQPAPSAAFFAVDVTGSNSPVTAGETLTVDATVTNAGDLGGTQDVTLAVDGATDSETVSLAGGASTDVTLDWSTAEGDSGNYTATVSSENDSATTPVTVEEPPEQAFFDVSITGSNSPVEEGETLSVDADVSNTGELSDTQTVELAVDGSTVDSQSVNLAGGDATSVTLEWNTADGDAGNYTATVSSENDSDTADVTVEEPPEPAVFDVSITGSNSPVEAGDTLSVDADVTNTGELAGTQSVALTVDGSTVDSQSVSLAGGDATSVTLEWDTADGDAGNYTATVSSENDSDTTDVTVEEPPEPAVFDVAVTGTNSPVEAGESLTANATIENTGDLGDTQTISLEVDGTARDTTDVTLASGEETDVTLSWDTAEGDAGNYTAIVSSANDSDSVGVTVDPAGIDGPESFEAYVRGDQGYLHTGTASDPYPDPIEFSRCDNFEVTDDYLDQEPDYLPAPECITASGTIDHENNTWNGDIDFPTTYMEQQHDLAGELYVEASITSDEDGASGTWNQETGEITLDTTVSISVNIYQAAHGTQWENVTEADRITDDTCHIPSVSLDASSEKSYDSDSVFTNNGTVSGERLDAGEAFLVSDDFSVGSAQDCGSLGGFVDLNPIINEELGVPAESGENEVAFDVDFAFDE